MVKRILCVMVAPRLKIAFVTVFVLGALGACTDSRQGVSSASNQVAPQPTPRDVPVSDGFVYPIGSNTTATQANDGDGWYNAQDFGVHDHLGEDWNAEIGGDSDCGQPVYAAAKGTIAFAREAGPGWGKVVIVRHRLPDNTIIETLYGHLQSFTRTSGDVERRERIGSVGNGDGAYPCHLHLELRFPDCPAWGNTGTGYGSNRVGWTDPSDFIDAHAPSSGNPSQRR